MNPTGFERSVRQFVDEVNHLAGEDSLSIIYSFWSRSMELRSRWGAELSMAPYDEERILAPVEQSAILEQLGLDWSIPTMGLDPLA